MRFDMPAPGWEYKLRELWREAFGDDDTFLGCFYTAGYAPGRCRVAVEGDALAAAAYWFDVSCRGQKMAYLYGVATAKAFRGRGICHALMADIHTLLKEAGYAGTVLVPAKPELRRLYAGMGYADFGGRRIISCPGGEAVPVHMVSIPRYEQRRRALLPEGGIEQPGAGTAFLPSLMGLYEGEDFLLAAWPANGTLIAAELLGDPAAAPGIVTALGAKQGRFPVPGGENRPDTLPFAMFRPLTENAQPPAYFGLAFD